MAVTYFHCKPPISGYSLYQNPASISLNPRGPNCAGKSSIPAAGRRNSQRLSIVASIGDGGASGSLGAPFEPISSIGRSLCDVLQDDPNSFYDAVSAELTDLAVDRDDAFDRMELSLGKPEACLHRRIVEMKEAEHFPIIEDIMYMIIYKKFKDINVPQIQSIDQCVWDRKWETSPSNDDDLKSIHSNEVMEAIQEYLNSVLGLNVKSIASVNLDPAITDMLRLRKIYLTSIFYGYFLKSASLRHSLERYMSASCLDIRPSNSRPLVSGSGFYGNGELSSMRSTALSRVQSPKSKPPQKLKSYVQGLDKDALRVCKEMRSQISLFLVQDHSMRLFSVEDSYSFDYCDPFLISLADLERLVLEAIAFGCFLWDADEYVDRLFNLRKNFKSTRMM